MEYYCVKCKRKLEPRGRIVKKAFPDNFNDTRNLRSSCCNAKIKQEEE